MSKPTSARRAEAYTTPPWSQKSASLLRSLARAGRKGAVLFLALALPAAAAPDGGEPLPPAVFAEQAQLLIPDAGWEEHGEGCWLPTRRCVATGQELERLRAENAELKRGPTATPAIVLVALGLGVVLGAVGGAYVIWQFKR